MPKSESIFVMFEGMDEVRIERVRGVYIITSTYHADEFAPEYVVSIRFTWESAYRRAFVTLANEAGWRHYTDEDVQYLRNAPLSEID